MQNWVEKGNQFLSPVLSHATTFEVAYGKGSTLVGKNGKTLLDFATGIGAAITGHCHPKVVEAIQTQASKLIHACAGVVYYEPNVALAEKIADLTGGNLSSVFFTQSGTEAIEAAIKLAYYTSGKTQILAFDGGFHGRSLGALSVTHSKSYQKGYPLVPGASFLPYPYTYRCPWGGASEAESTQKGIQALEDYFSTNGKNLAGVLIETEMGEGGYVPAPDAFLIRLRQLCTEYGVHLIFDEIQTGMGRCGDWFSYQAIQKSTGVSVEPDIIALAKGIGSGMPIGACVSRPEIMKKWNTGAHGGTYSGNPVTSAAALATIEVLTPIIPTIAAKRALLLKELEKFNAIPCVGNIRGRGIMLGIEIVTDKTSKKPDPDRVKAIRMAALEKGLLVVSCGYENSTIRLIPPLTISDADLISGLNTLYEVINGNY